MKFTKSEYEAILKYAKHGCVWIECEKCPFLEGRDSRTGWSNCTIGTNFKNCSSKFFRAILDAMIDGDDVVK